MREELGRARLTRRLLRLRSRRIRRAKQLAKVRHHRDTETAVVVQEEGETVTTIRQQSASIPVIEGREIIYLSPTSVNTFLFRSASPSSNIVLRHTSARSRNSFLTPEISEWYASRCLLSGPV